MMEAAGDGGQRKTTPTAAATSAAAPAGKKVVLNWTVSGKRVNGSYRAGLELRLLFDLASCGIRFI